MERDYSNNRYNISDLYLARLSDSEWSNNDIFFIVNKRKHDVGYDCDVRHCEVYEECLLSMPISRRFSSTPFESIPDEIIELRNFPTEFCNEKEILHNEISDIRLFSLFQEYNLKEKSKVKVI